jgi:hypothetical protein
MPEIKKHIEIPLIYTYYEEEEIWHPSHLGIFTGWLDHHLCLFRIQILDTWAMDGVLIFGVGIAKFYFNVIYTPY